MTITLDDVASLLYLPIIGAFHSFEPLHMDEAMLMLVELLEVSGEEARAETAQCHGAYSGSYAWGATALVHMYDYLNDACKSGGQQLAGYITLLQCWIYEHFPSVHESVIDLEYDETSPHACRWLTMKACSKGFPASTYWTHIDALTIPDVCWMPYGGLRWGPVVVTHRPERVVRQFGYVQTIPPLPMGASLSYEDIDNKWMHYSDHLVAGGQICLVPRQCAPDYMDWFFGISHSFITPTQTVDLPRHPSVPQHDTYEEPDIPEVLVALEVGPSHAPSDAEMCAKRSQKGWSVDEVMENCIRIARGVTTNGNVYVRARRRRRTYQS
ncbi:Protein MAINTENANCE OF MERISTEMS [Glycine max]|nr:Protein MAINTENANCE OF MERISTEMS [Glycine max]